MNYGALEDIGDHLATQIWQFNGCAVTILQFYFVYQLSAYLKVLPFGSHFCLV